MLLSAPAQSQLTLPMLEGCVTVVALALAFCFPRLASSLYCSIERPFVRLAFRRRLAVFAVGIAALFLRLAILPVCPIPLPFLPTDFSFLLSADTFAHGRVTNPTPVMWMHFESIHITMNPAYMSMYFPSNGLVLAAGQLLFGHPWFGLLIVNALMCAAVCWMLQAWLPPTWALLGGLLAILHLGLFSYWINTYSGAGAISALAGALVLGSLPRLKRTAAMHYGLLMAAGMAMLALTRPYEGLLLCLPVTLSLGHWAVFDKNKNNPGSGVLLRRAVLPLLLLVTAASWMGYYDYQNFGSPTTLPYTVDRNTYAMAPYFVWQPARPEPAYHHAAMRQFYVQNELTAFQLIHKPSGFLPQTLIKLIRSFLFYAGFALLIPLLMLRRIFLDRRVRFLVIATLIFAAGMIIQIFMVPHYLAPFTAAFYAIGLQGMRHLWVWKPGKQPAGRTLVRLTVTVCLLMASLRLFAGPLHFRLAEYPTSEWNGWWYGPGHFGATRADLAAKLNSLPGKQLALVRYSDQHNPLDEWVYNSANIDDSKVIWAREMDPAHNAALLEHYGDRHVWLVQPDIAPSSIAPYSTPTLLASVR